MIPFDAHTNIFGLGALWQFSLSPLLCLPALPPKSRGSPPPPGENEEAGPSKQSPRRHPHFPSSDTSSMESEMVPCCPCSDLATPLLLPNYESFPLFNPFNGGPGGQPPSCLIPGGVWIFFVNFLCVSNKA